MAIYARVAPAEHRTNLDHQAARVAAFCAAKGWHVATVVKACGSGGNEEQQRPQFLALVQHQPQCGEHTGRYSRFDVAYIPLSNRAQYEGPRLGDTW